MSFLNPLFLFGLVALSIPVIIHMINLRKPERLPFSTISFFEQLQKSTIKKLKIKEYLLLALRLLAILFLVLGLARPFLRSNQSGTNTGNAPVLFGILFDNSPSMSQIDKNGPYIEQEKQFANAIIREANDHDRFLIFNTNGELLNNSLLTKQAAEKLLKKIEVANKGEYAGSRLESLYKQSVSSEFDRAVLYWLSDAQKTLIESVTKEKFFRPVTKKSQSRVPLNFVRFGSRFHGNVAITHLKLPDEIITKDKPIRLITTVRNFSNEPAVNEYLSLKVHNKILGQYDLRLAANQSRQFMFEVPVSNSADVTGKVELEGDPYKFDNSRFFSIKVPRQKVVLLIEPRNVPGSGNKQSYVYQALKAAEELNGQLNVRKISIDSLTYVNWQSFDSVILNGLNSIPDYLLRDLQNYVQNGHGLILIPSEKAELYSYNRMLELFNAGHFAGFRGEYGAFRKVASFDQIREGHPVLEGIFQKEKDQKIRVDLPDLFYYWLFKSGEKSGDMTIIQSNLSDPLFVEHKYGRGILLISSLGMDPGWSNFPANALYAPLLYRMAMFASSANSGGLQSFTLGKSFEWRVPYQSGNIKIILNGETYKPDMRTVSEGLLIHYDAESWTPGLAAITDGTKKNIIAANTDIMESDFTTLNNKTLDKLVKSSLFNTKIFDVNSLNPEEINRQIRSTGFGTEIWNWFLWIGLFLLLIETMVAKSYRTDFIE